MRTIIRPALALALLGSCAAQAQQPTFLACGPRAPMVHNLAQTYGERQITWEIGDPAGTFVLEFWASPTGTWTLVSTNTRGVSCFVDAGTGAAPTISGTGA